MEPAKDAHRMVTGHHTGVSVQRDGHLPMHRCTDNCFYKKLRAKGSTLCFSDPPQEATSLQMRQHFTSCVWPDGFLSLVLRLGSSVR